MDLTAYRDGSTEPWVVEILCALVKAQKPSIIIETGTFKGMTTRKLAEAAATYADEKFCQIFTVESNPEMLETIRATINPSPSYVAVATCDATEFLRMFDGPVDFIFLDDDHTAEHVREEVRLALKILRPGGILCGHDVVGTFGLGQVFKEAGGIVLDLPRMHIAGGLGVIVK